jgi:PncC family amidohydrolase
MIGSAITSVAGSSDYFLGGVIAYSNNVKAKVLGVGSGILRSKGEVSAQTVAAMARGAQRLLGADCAIGISGVAGPGGGTKPKPVGLVYVGIAAEKVVRTFEYRFEGNRQAVRRQATVAALARMIEAVTASLL